MSCYANTSRTNASRHILRAWPGKTWRRRMKKATGIWVCSCFVGFLEHFGFGVPIGGSGALTNALIACIEDHGGTALSGIDVVRVTNRNGRAHGRAHPRRTAV